MPQKAFGKLNSSRVREPAEDAVRVRSELGRNFFRDVRMRMPVKIHPPGSDAVDILISLLVVITGAFRPDDSNGRLCGSKVRERMPDILQILFLRRRYLFHLSFSAK